MTTTITIRETGTSADGFSATIQFGPHAPIDISVRDPFSADEERQLEWYFEEWLTFPFTDTVAAQQVADSVRAYGEALFQQIFRDNPDAYVEYRALGDDLLLEIVGSPDFHTLHWEAIHDPNQTRPLAVEVPVVRKNLAHVPYRAELRPAPLLRVLLVTARPGGIGDVSYRTISRPLVEALDEGAVAAQIDIVRPGTFEALVKHLDDTKDQHGDGYHHILHLDMHGMLLTYAQYQKLARHQHSDSTMFRGFGQDDVEPYEGQRAFIFFDPDPNEGDGKAGRPVSADDLAKLLNARQIPIAVLNACQSGKQVGDVETSLGSRLLAAGVQLVVAMGYAVTVSAARILMVELYERLLAGNSPATAIRRARLELYNRKKRRVYFNQEIELEDWMLPVVYQNEPPQLDANTFEGQPPDRGVPYSRRDPMHGFVGRDLDILQIERHLLGQRSVLLVRGMGGAGKSTLLHHLGWWWQTTQLVREVFYFGYDERAYTLPQIVQAIGTQLGLPLSGIAAQDRALVLRHLRSTRHLLILDNLESVTGERLAVQNTLNAEQQTALRDFLRELAGDRPGQETPRTLVLLGSRAGEAWLRAPQGPLREVDIYEMPGLDAEAQSDLARAILQSAGAPRYYEDDEHKADFQRLLRLLGGYPLAMEVVLGNLRDAKPGAVIERLQGADVSLDRVAGGQGDKESADDVIRLKTESILKCIEYSHSNLSAQAQALLLCLAPFTGVINTQWLPQYTEQLRAQTALADLPFQQWESVLQEAARWGLLAPHEIGGGYLRLQPTFPYFLKSRLNQEDEAAQKQAVEQAFRAHYDEIGGALAQWIQSKEPQGQQLGQTLIGVEYENLMTALNFALDEHVSILRVYLKSPVW